MTAVGWAWLSTWGSDDEYIVLGPQNVDVIRHDRWTGENDHMWIIDRGPDSLTSPLPLR